MDAKALTPRDLFDGKVRYDVPPFQRPYVWTEEDQWAPLWEDIERVVEAVLALTPESRLTTELPSHFLGAVVLKQLPIVAGDPTQWSVIDGQQRLTTLQLLLDAAQLVAAEMGDPSDAESLQELVLNDAARFRETQKRFKFWPSRIDQSSFESAMDNDHASPADSDSRIVQAHQFFTKAIRDWAIGATNSEGAIGRLRALTEVLEGQLQLVAISLGGRDEDQLIFETLNDRGTPLLAADLIKNYVFQRCETLSADVDTWSDKYWLDFDADWWRDEVAQGRLYRSRIDLFLQYWLTMRIRDEVLATGIFRSFRAYADQHLNDTAAAEEFLAGLRRDADSFKDFTQLDPDSAPGRFYSRVVESLELGAFIPLLLWLMSSQSGDLGERDRALTALESWAVRRTLLRLTMKDVNKFVVALLRELDQHPDEVGQAMVRYLSEQTADARLWPSDDQLREGLPKTRVYGNIKQKRLRTVLDALERKARTERHEDVSLPTRLEIEHIMPKGWRTYWGEGVVGDPVREAERDQLLNTLGNLTLVTQKLNVALSNRPWRDDEAQEVAPTGKDAGKGKRSLLDRFSVLLLNKDIVEQHVSAWTEEDIVRRSAHFAEMVSEIWPRG